MLGTYSVTAAEMRNTYHLKLQFFVQILGRKSVIISWKLGHKTSIRLGETLGILPEADKGGEANAPQEASTKAISYSPST